MTRPTLLPSTVVTVLLALTACGAQRRLEGARPVGAGRRPHAVADGRWQGHKAAGCALSDAPGPAGPLSRTLGRFSKPGAALAILLAIGLGSTAGAAGPSPRELTADGIAGFFDAAMAAEMRDHPVVGAVVSVVHDGEVVLNRGYGWADLEARVAADAHQSLFRIASISKPFIWTAVMQLVEQGRLDLDDNVNDHLRAFRIPDTWPEPVRIRHLLSHAAGFEDRAIGMSARSLAARQPLPEYLANNMPARVRPPGEHVAYSNWGTSLAAHIVAEISGQSWADYVDTHILAPLEMHSTSTHMQPPPDLMARMAKSYTWENGAFVAQRYAYINDAPAGAISTTADDMTRFMIAHLDHGIWQDRRILADATARQMQLPLHAPHPGIAPMLHGFYRADRNGEVISGHGGDTNQFHSQLALFPEHNLGVFISFNADPADDARTHLLQAFVDHFFPAEHLRTAPQPASTPLDAYVGEYIPLRSSWSTIERLATLLTGVQVSAVGGELLLHGTSTSRWRPESATANDRFVGRYDRRVLVFERDGDTSGSAVSHMLIDSPLDTWQRVEGLDAPGNQRYLLITMALLALAAVCGYGWRAVSRAQPARRLPAITVLLAWLHAALLLGLYGYLAKTLYGDVDDMVFGVTRDAHLALMLIGANSAFGVLVLLAAVSHWTGGRGSVGARVRYTAFAVAAVINLWMAWYFNMLGYVFEHLS